MSDLHQNEVSSRTVTAFFDSKSSADKADADLIALGIPREHITVTGQSGPASAENDKGFWDSLKDLFLPDEDRSAYAEGLRRGGYVVAVRTEDGNYNRVLDVLDQDGAVDLADREATWRKEGWTGYATQDNRSAATPLAAPTAASPAAAPTSGLANRSGVTAAENETIPIYEETLRVGKRDVNHGRVRVRSYVVETPVTERVSLRSETVQVDRRPVDRPVEANDALFQDRVIEAEEHVEEAVVAKEARVKEEIALRKTAEDRSQTISDKVRHTEVEVQDERGTTPVAGTVDASRIAEHMDVVGSDGVKLGTVDHLDGPDRIKLAKSTAPDGQHHYVPVAWVSRLDKQVHLKRTAAEARANW